MSLRPAAGVRFENTVEVAVIGAGACGLTAALAAADAGAEVLLLERDPSPSGSTALSSGMIPACASRWQRRLGVGDSVEQMAADIQRKNRHQAEPQIVDTVCRQSAPTLEWLADRHQVALELVQGFLYPGHSAERMHAPPERTGSALQTALLNAASNAGLDLLCDAVVDALYTAVDGRVRGLNVRRPDGSEERLACSRLILACNGYGGNPRLLAEHIPEIADALYFGHAGNRGDALRWGEALGAETRHLGAYQGHGSVAVPQQILITWALMMNGGIQVNVHGERFANEHAGYSEQAVAVLAQPHGLAWCVYDQTLHQLGLEFDDYRRAVELGAVKHAASSAELAHIIDLPGAALAHSIEQTAAAGHDRFGRDLGATPALVPPLYAVKVTGALFHTQGGLRVDPCARVLYPGGRPLPNLYAAGGAACGVSGPGVAGYLSGNGLLTAVVSGRIAGTGAAGG